MVLVKSKQIINPLLLFPLHGYLGEKKNHLQDGVIVGNRKQREKEGPGLGVGRNRRAPEWVEQGSGLSCCVCRRGTVSPEDVELPFPLSFVGFITFSALFSTPQCPLAAIKCLGGVLY